MAKVKPYCQCDLDKIFLGSLNCHPVDKWDEKIVKVHYSNYQTGEICCRPTQEVWQSFIANCLECGKLFSSPWETRCKPCHAEVSDLTYLSWRHARNVSIDDYNFYLTANRQRVMMVTQTQALERPTGSPYRLQF